MRKVFLEQNLGKKSRCRFPVRNAKKNIIKLLIESQKAVSTPSLTQPLVISGVNVIDFCDRFNQESQNFEFGLKIKSVVTVNLMTKTFDLKLVSPTVYNLINRVSQSTKLRNYQLMLLIYNIALIKLINDQGNSYNISDLKAVIKQISGNFRSLNGYLSTTN